MTNARKHQGLKNIRAAAEKIRSFMVRRMKRTTEKRNTKHVQVVLRTVDWPLAFELDGDSRFGGDAWTCDR